MCFLVFVLNMPEGEVKLENDFVMFRNIESSNFERKTFYFLFSFSVNGNCTSRFNKQFVFYFFIFFFQLMI